MIGLGTDDVVTGKTTGGASVVNADEVMEQVSRSGGQNGLIPVQVSVKSQYDSAYLHICEDGANLSAGQAAAVPVQYSSKSQSPTENLHNS